MMPLEKPSRTGVAAAINIARRAVPISLKLAIRGIIAAAKLKGEALVGRHKCSVCDQRVMRFNPLPPDHITHDFKYSPDEAEMCNAASYSCPRCGATDRERLYALYLREYFVEITRECAGNEVKRFVDFAPSIALSNLIKKLTRGSACAFDYRTADFFRDDVDDKVNIEDMKIYPDESVDFFVCSHILEHVTDDKKALRELNRILKKGGQGILVVPIVLTLKEIDEDPSVIDPSERWRRFGQDDHVRLYSKEGFLMRVDQAGFVVRQLGQDHFGKQTLATHGITQRSIMYIVAKDM